MKTSIKVTELLIGNKSCD